MDKLVIFCESYPQIRNTLYLVAQNSGRSITVVSGSNASLYALFQTLNERVFNDTLNLARYSFYSARFAQTDNKIKKALTLLPDIIREKRHLRSIYDTHFAACKQADVYFFSRYFNPETFYLLKKLSKNNRLVYMQDPTYDSAPVPQSPPKNLRDIAHLIWGKSVYGYDIILGEHSLGQKILGMPDRFFREKVSKVIDAVERDAMLRDLDMSRFQVFDTGNYSVVYLHQDWGRPEYVTDVALFQQRLAGVFTLIRKHFPEDAVAIKYHPGFSGSKEPALSSNVLPDFVPAEFLYSDKTKLYLSISSMALANVEKGLAVSLIDIVNFRDETTRERLREIMLRLDRSKVLFPKSLEELEKIIINLKE